MMSKSTTFTTDPVRLPKTSRFRSVFARLAIITIASVLGSVIDLPELDSGAMYKIDSGGLSYWAGAHIAEGDGALKPLERERVKLWLGRAYAQLNTLGSLI